MHLLSILQLMVAISSVVATYKTSKEVDDSILDTILEDPQLSAALDDPDKLLSMIRARYPGGVDEDEDRTGYCEITEDRAKMIIRTEESTKAGAIFLSSPSVKSRQECIDECCSNDTCTTAVVKEMDSGSAGCYLFNCLSPNVCHFSPNKGFSAVDVTHERPPKGHMSTIYSVTSSGVKSMKGYLYSACDKETDCYDYQHVQCTNGYCMCQPDYHAVGDLCRKNCGQYEFECANRNNGNKVECIPVYSKCDGVAQCEDGSDELHCSDELVSANTSSKPRVPVPTVYPSSFAISQATQSRVNVTKIVPTGNVTKHQPSESVTIDDHNIEIESHRLEWTVPAVKGAVIALVLGVIIVFVLLVFAGCQIHRMRWRSRKVRRRNGNDADYLINGMYL